MAGAATILAPYWQEGIRQELALCMAGFLHKTQATSEAIEGPEPLFYLNKRRIFPIP